MFPIKKLVEPVSHRPLLSICFLSLPLAMAGVQSIAITDGSTVYPQVAREMLHSGDWITPHLNGAVHLDKPPLVYWLIGLSQYLFGEREISARIWSVLAYWFTIPVIAGIGARLYGKRAGWLSALVFCTCMGPYLFSRLAAPDLILCFWIVLAVLSYIRAAMEKERHGLLFMLVMFGSLGMAGLTKGLLGMGLPAGIIGLHAVLGGRWRIFLSLRAAGGIAFMLAIQAPWYILTARANPDFLWYFFVREHVLRFTGQRYPRDEYLSAPVFLAFALTWTFPWAGLVPQAITGAFHRLRIQGWRKAEDLLPCLWCFLVIGLFTASGSRLEYYSLPAIPAVSLLLGRFWDESMQGSSGIRSGFTVLSLAFMGIVLMSGAIAAWNLLGPSKEAIFQFMSRFWPSSGLSGADGRIAALDQLRIPSTAVLTGAAVASFAAAIGFYLSRPKFACALLVGLMIPVFLLSNWGFFLMEPFMSSRPIAGIITAGEPVDAVVIEDPHEYMWTSGIAYYCRKKLYVLKKTESGSLFSPQREQTGVFISREGLRDLCGSGKRIALVLERTPVSEARAMLSPLPFKEIGRAGPRVVYITGKQLEIQTE